MDGEAYDSSDFKRCPGNSPFCLVEFDCCGTQHLDSDDDHFFVKRKNKKGRKPLSPSSRFNRKVTCEDIDKASKGCVPENTSRSTGWALRTFQAWARQRNERSGDLCPVDLFDKSYAPDVTCNCLQRFVLEARREDGTRYPPKTIYSILCGLLRHSRLVQDDPPNFLDRKDVKLHGTCDVAFREL